MPESLPERLRCLRIVEKMLRQAEFNLAGTMTTPLRLSRQGQVEALKEVIERLKGEKRGLFD